MCEKLEFTGKKQASGAALQMAVHKVKKKKRSI
jgi:hypothetical protein